MAQDVSGIEIRIDGKQAIQEAGKLERRFDSLGRAGTKTEGSFERLSRKSISTGGGFDALRRRSFSLQTAFRGLSGVAAGLGVILTFKELTSTLTLFEKLEGSLTTATGSAFAASRAFDELERFAANTPASLDEVVGAFIKLKNFGLDPSQEALRSYGNTAAALGKSLDQMIEAVADATNLEMERLREFGIVAKQQGEEVAFTFQGVTTVVGRNAAEIEGYLRQIGDVNFAGAMEDQMGRLPGLFSNLGDSVARLFREMGEAGVTDILATGLRQAISVVNSLADSVDAASVTLQANFEMWKTSIDNTLLKFGTSIDEVSPKIAQLGGGFIEFASTAATAISNIPPVVEAAVQVIQADFNIVRAVLIAGWMKIEQGATLAWENITFAAASAWENIKSSFFSALSEMGNKLATFSELAVRALPVLPGFDLALRPAVSAAAEALRGLSDSSDTAQSKLSQLEAQHKKNVAAIHGQINAINDAKDATVSAAQAEISAAREGLQASLNAREKRIDSLMREKASMELLDDRAAAVLKTLEKNTKATGENAGSSEEAAKAAKKLSETFKSLSADLQKQIALYGRTGETAQLRYELEKGALKDLSTERKAHLLSLSKELTAMDANMAKFEEMQSIRERGLQIFKSTLPESEQRKIQEAELQFLFDKGAFGEGQQAVETLNRAMENLRETSRGTGDVANDLGLTFSSAFEKAITQAESFRDVLGGIARDMVAIFTRKQVTEPLAKGISNFVDEIDFGSIFGGVFHQGGIVGQGGPARMVPAMAFADAPRYHNGGLSGFRPDERPAVLRMGEEVLPASHPRHRNNQGNAEPPLNVTIYQSNDFRGANNPAESRAQAERIKQETIAAVEAGIERGGRMSRAVGRRL